ncbi:MAG: GGDEF domain-containing protein [Hydrogenophilales bacterium]|nr:GGDEF domain-containing protein [Hydrogenophilales bacterium]
MYQPGQSADPALHEVIESIVSLTEQRDQRSLEHSLFSSFQEMLDHEDCWLLSRERDDDELRIVAGDGRLLPDVIFDLLKAGVPDADIRIVRAGAKEYLLACTLSADDEQARLLAIARGAWDDGNLRLVRGMLKVYRNFVSVLRDSAKDTLTGLFNRRRMEAKLNDLLAASLHGRRYKDQNYSDFLAVLDLDNFKRVNDTYGHLIGDETLLAFANILRQTLRDDDLIYRYGGEEFVVLLQELTQAQAAKVLERVRRNVEKHAFPQVGRVTVSIGHTRLKPGSTPPKAIEEADRALYHAKKSGRNQAHGFQELVSSGALQDHLDNSSVELF